MTQYQNSATSQNHAQETGLILETLYQRINLADTISDLFETASIELFDEKEHRKHLGASLIGDPCKRKLWYSFRWCHREEFNGRMYRLFNRGHREEPAINKILRHIGFSVTDIDEVTGKQLRFSACDGHFGGSCDGVGYLPDRFKYPREMLFEFKTSGDNMFKKMVKEGVRKCKPVHFDQMCTYGKAFKIDYAIYIMVNKNDDRVHIEIVKLDWDRADALERKAAEIITATEPPERLSLNPAHMACKDCSMAGICHGGQSVEINCRSCRHSHPIEQSMWACDKNQNAGPIPDHIIKTGQACWEAIC